jgi:hypothetical protein
VLGKPRAFAHLLIFIAALAAILFIGSRALDSAFAFLWLTFLVVGSGVALWGIWKDRGNPRAHTFPSQLAAMPKRWQKWVLGESDDDRK